MSLHDDLDGRTKPTSGSLGGRKSIRRSQSLADHLTRGVGSEGVEMATVVAISTQDSASGFDLLAPTYVGSG